MCQCIGGGVGGVWGISGLSILVFMSPHAEQRGSIKACKLLFGKDYFPILLSRMPQEYDCDWLRTGCCSCFRAAISASRTGLWNCSSICLPWA